MLYDLDNATSERTECFPLLPPIFIFLSCKAKTQHEEAKPSTFLHYAVNRRCVFLRALVMNYCCVPAAALEVP